MAYKFIVEKYGKINHAEIEISPLTLFVGDNNSGKSYLLSLIWGILSGNQSDIIFGDLNSVLTDRYQSIYEKIFEFILDDQEIGDSHITLEETDLLTIFNELLTKNKDNLVKSIFNYENMTIGNITVASDSNEKIVLTKQAARDNAVRVNINSKVYMGSFVFPRKDSVVRHVGRDIIRILIESVLKVKRRHESAYYLPAARTGFMLAKNVINQVGRKKAFDVFEISQSEDDTQITPFPKTIIHFLDSIDNLNMQKENDNYRDLVDWITTNMSKGDVECDEENSGNIQYVPSGMDQGIPLRASSGVVTELTPLILLLKYSKVIKYICYEEPEMCLHPQLQFQMAKLLIRLANKSINIIATTHSDIILQHVNNMCQLKAVHNDAVDLNEIGLNDQDLINTNRVSIYQFRDSGNVAIVEKIIPQNNVFEVPSFMKALKSILDQTISVSNIVESGEV